MPDIRIYPTAALAARAIAGQIVDLCDDAINARGRFTLALSGGSTPEQLYRLLATDEFASRIDWENVHLFWGDERCVPPSHADSNYHTARMALIDHVPVTLSHVHRIHGELPPELAAVQYEQDLRAFFGRREGASGARFDLVLLGMGDDGHTASLFPGGEELAITNRWVVASHPTSVQHARVTLTPTALNEAQRAFFFVSGESKAPALARAVVPPASEDDMLPVHYIQPVSGAARWYIDAAAARVYTAEQVAKAES